MAKKIGLVLGSGSARGLAHIGVLKVLHKENIPVDLVVGSSFGALIGSIYATGMDPEEVAQKFCKLTRRWSITTFFPRFHISGFVGGSMLQRFLHTFLEDIEFDDLKIPFTVVATDIETGEEILINEGSVKQSVRASMSLPVVFIPVHYNGRILVDGGLVNPLPVNIAKEMGADIIIACNVIPKAKQIAKYIGLRKKNWRFPLDCFLRPERIRLPNMKKVLFQFISVMEDKILIANLREAKPTILIEPKVGHFKSAEFHRAKEIIACGEEAMEIAMPALKRVLNNS
ncbi:patatin-like phospholipase family protein [candidate division WOR-3 bacterium]|nr:patatin-like phospholipase family protein [candidate division WOR-3 bacterium]